MEDVNPNHQEPSRPIKLTKKDIQDLIEKGTPQIFRWEDDDVALRAAAAQSRLPFDKLTSQELAAFPDSASCMASAKLYLYIRNKALQMWLLEPNVELTKEHVQKELVPPYNSDRSLVYRVHAFLQRYGYINFGWYHTLSLMRKNGGKKQQRVLVIGAGASGIAAASQLSRWGMHVTVIEARTRLGGRVHTHKGSNTGHITDLGGMLVTGICGNPLITLSRQYLSTLVKLNTYETPIYDNRGKMVDPRQDKLVQEAFNRVDQIASFVVHERGIDSMGGEPLDLHTTYENIMCLMELSVQRRRKLYYDTYEEVTLKLKAVQDELLVYQKSAELVAQKLMEAEQRPLAHFDSKLEKDIVRKCLRRDLAAALKRYDQLDGRRKHIEASLTNLRKMEPHEVYMNDYDRKLLDFHMANLEYANGTSLRNVSLKHWDQDDENRLQGSHFYVKEGMMHLFHKLITLFKPKLGRVVKEIEYNEEGVRVTCENVVDGGTETFEGDAVLCTVPLGILKRSVEGHKEAPSFNPPLPQDKVDAIKSLGFGNLNKVVLMFDEIFWDKDVHFFGNIPTNERYFDKQSTGSQECSRGELYMFIALPSQPVLIGLLAGDSAYTNLPIEKVVNRAMAVLTNIFGNTCPPSAKEAVVTVWHKDDFATGSYSYLATHSKPEDYDTLAASVRGVNEEGERTGTERLFFAGEHTNRNYPATVHGAFLSGLREAGHIADVLVGVPYLESEGGEEEKRRREEGEEVLHIDDDEEDDDDCVMLESMEERFDARPRMPQPVVAGRGMVRAATVGGPVRKKARTSMDDPAKGNEEKMEGAEEGGVKGEADVSSLSLSTSTSPAPTAATPPPVVDITEEDDDIMEIDG